VRVERRPVTLAPGDELALGETAVGLEDPALGPAAPPPGTRPPRPASPLRPLAAAALLLALSATALLLAAD